MTLRMTVNVVNKCSDKVWIDNYMTWVRFSLCIANQKTEMNHIKNERKAEGFLASFQPELKQTLFPLFFAKKSWFFSFLLCRSLCPVQQISNYILSD